MLTELTVPVSKVMGATDACPWGLGACETRLGQRKAEQLFKQADLKGERVKLGVVLASESASKTGEKEKTRSTLVSVCVGSVPGRSSPFLGPMKVGIPL